MKDSKRKSNDHPFSIGGRASKTATARQSLDLCLLPLSTNTGVIPAFRAPTTSSWYLLPTYHNSLFFNLIMFDPISKNLGSGLSYPMSSEVRTAEKYPAMRRVSRASLISLPVFLFSPCTPNFSPFLSKNLKVGLTSLLWPYLSAGATPLH